VNDSGKIATAIDDPPHQDALVVQLRLVNDEPRPDGKHARTAIEIGTNPTRAGPRCEIVQSFIDSPKDQLGSINSAVNGNVVEEIREIALRLERFDDWRLRHRAVATYEPRE
jgi:hypothetical protein